jgi:hypothetical protein
MAWLGIETQGVARNVSGRNSVLTKIVITGG